MFGLAFWGLFCFLPLPSLTLPCPCTTSCWQSPSELPLPGVELSSPAPQGTADPGRTRKEINSHIRVCPASPDPVSSHSKSIIRSPGITRRGCVTGLLAVASLVVPVPVPSPGICGMWICKAGLPSPGKVEKCGTEYPDRTEGPRSPPSAPPRLSGCVEVVPPCSAPEPRGHRSPRDTSPIRHPHTACGILLSQGDVLAELMR